MVVYKAVTIYKHLDIEYDLGSLLAVDPNLLDSQLLRQRKDDYLLDLTRDNVQLLFNQIWELPSERIDEAIVAKLPPQKTILPRTKPAPKPRPPTKWEQYAKEKGINKKKKSKLTWDEELKKWVPRYGFKRAKADADKNWVIEVPGNADPMEDQFAKKSHLKAENIAKNELQRLRNIAKAKNIKVPRFGLLNPNASSSKDLQAAVTVAKSSTASLGKFQRSLPNEKEARGVSVITPGASRKRKLPPVSSEKEKEENLNVIDKIIKKKPRLNIEKAVSRHLGIKPNQIVKDKNSERR